MIQIRLMNRYKSLTSPFELNLPDFTVLSGINGGGKSHLLTAIEQDAAKVYINGDVQLTSKKYVTSQSLVPNEQQVANRESLTYETTSLHQSIQSYLQNAKTDTSLTLEKHFSYAPNSVYAIRKISEETGINLGDLTIQDIKEYYPVALSNSNELFQQNFSNVFKRYIDKYEDNLYFEYLSKYKGVNKKYIDESEFVKRHGEAPWTLVDKIFSEANIDYVVNSPLENDRDLPFTFKLKNKTSGAEVPFFDLSSGEKILVSLALAVYNSSFDFSVPDILLLDELDAHLHPSMAQQLLRVVEEIFVKQKGIKVVMTTHSPSTVALAPEASLHIMQRENPRVQKKSKEWIMKLLTQGIPSFSIYADNRRQVFVESKVDVEFYTKIYNKAKNIIPSDKSLYFICSGSAKQNSGNCDQVREIVNLLANNGNQTVYGIIDWDGKNSGNDRVFVLGQNQRYSIENYVLDPLVLASFLLREKIVEREFLGLSHDENYYNFPSFDSARLQAIVDIIIKYIIDKTSFVVPSGDLSLSHYNNGELVLRIPTWYITHKGHDLENLIKNAFPQLNQFIPLSTTIVNKTLDDIPAFISLDIINLFQNIHNA